MLKQRVITALLLAAIFIPGILFLPYAGFALLLALVVIAAAWEWSRLAGWQTLSAQLGYALAIAGLLGLGFLFPRSLPYWLGLALLWWLLALYWVFAWQGGRALLPEGRAVKGLLGLCILPPAWLALIALHREWGGVGVLLLLMLIWTADIAAYFSGRRWGRRKLADKVSPGKSWEGVYGALLASLIFAALALLLAPLTLSLGAQWALLALSLLTVLFSILGDLLESLFKRQMQVKDSSQLLPGHGGVLDRIDSLSAAAPIFMLGLTALKGAQLL